MTRRRSLDETKELLVAAGLELLEQQGLAISLKHLSLLDVCKKAGLGTAGSAYKIWPNQDAFRADLMHAAFRVSSTRSTTEPAVIGLLSTVEHTPVGLRELVRVAGALDASGVIGAPSYHTYLALWSLAATDEALAAELRAADSDILELLASLYTMVADQFCLEWVAPFTPQLLATTLSALVEGMAIRARYDPTTVPTNLLRGTGPDGAEVPWHLFSCAAEAIVNAFLRPRGSSSTDAIQQSNEHRHQAGTRRAEAGPALA